MTSILEVKDLNVARGNKAVIRDVSMRIVAGQTTAVLGPNGAGKSTLVLALAGVLPATSGSVLLDGTDITGRRPEHVRRLGVAAIPEGHHILTKLTVEDNLEAAGSMHDKAGVAQAAERAFAVFPELKDIRMQIAGTLSGGQRQMVAVAQALMSQPKFILADEMSLGLAPLIVKRLMAVIGQLAADGIGILLIEQFMHIALGMSQHAYVLNRGRVLFDGPPADIEADPSIVHEAYLAGEFERSEERKGAR